MVFFFSVILFGIYKLVLLRFFFCRFLLCIFIFLEVLFFKFVIADGRGFEVVENLGDENKVWFVNFKFVDVIIELFLFI